MKILHEFPPNYAEIVARFPVVADRPGVIFCWGDTIFQPQRCHLGDEIIAHEAVHRVQQGEDVEGWWRRYLDDDDFRFEQELAAHQAEYQALAMKATTRNERRWYQKVIAQKIASPIYGRMIGLERAKKLIVAAP